MRLSAREATGCATLTVLADRDYLNGEQVLACEGTGVLTCVPQDPDNTKRMIQIFGVGPLLTAIRT